MPDAQSLLNGLLSQNGITNPSGKYDFTKAGLSNGNAAVEILGMLGQIATPMREIGLGADSKYLGGIDSRDGSIVLNKDKPSLSPTVLHEVIHSVQKKLFEPVAKSNDPAYTQFKAAYADMQKAYAEESKRQNAVNDPAESAAAKKFAEYRYSPEERLAFGVNALFTDAGVSGRIPHMDATAMTDFLVLADMLGQAKTSSGKK